MLVLDIGERREGCVTTKAREVFSGSCSSAQLNHIIRMVDLYFGRCQSYLHMSISLALVALIFMTMVLVEKSKAVMPQIRARISICKGYGWSRVIWYTE